MTISHKHDRLTVSRNLDGSRSYCIGCNVETLGVLKRPLTPKAHANTVRRADGEFTAEKPRDLRFFEIVKLRPWNDPYPSGGKKRDAIQPTFTAVQRLRAAQYGYVSVTESIQQNYELIKQILESYGISMTRRQVRAGVERIREESIEEASKVLTDDVPRRNLSVA